MIILRAKLYSFIMILAFTQASHAAGMPQLDPKHVTSQIFWLLISFGLMYLLMHRFALPLVQGIIDIRERTIQDNLKDAAKLRSDAEDIKIAFDKALREADEKAREHIEAQEEKIQTLMSQRLEEANNRIQSMIKEVEEEIAEERNRQISSADKTVKELSKKMVDAIIKSKLPEISS